jgi:hypothetical protein
MGQDFGLSNSPAITGFVTGWKRRQLFDSAFRVLSLVSLWACIPRRISIPVGIRICGRTRTVVFNDKDKQV